MRFGRLILTAEKKREKCCFLNFVQHRTNKTICLFSPATKESVHGCGNVVPGRGNRSITKKNILLSQQISNIFDSAGFLIRLRLKHVKLYNFQTFCPRLQCIADPPLTIQLDKPDV